MSLRQQLPVERAGERLNAALRRADQHRQTEEIAQGLEVEAHKTDDKVGEDAHKDHLARAKTPGQHAVENREGESDDLHHQQHEHHVHAAKAARIAKDRGHVNDGAHAVDVEKVGDQKEHQRLVTADIRKRLFQGVHGLAQDVPFTLHAVLLVDVFEDRDGKDEPPHGREQEGKLGRRFRGDADAIAKLDERECDDQRNGRAADVPKAVAVGRHLVDARFVGDVVQKRVIVHARAVKADG